MTDAVLVVLFTLAIAIGYLLGRRKSVKLLNALPGLAPDKSYFQGLNFLLNEQPDKAVEEFVRLLDVNTHTLETHLALGKLMRKQGQVDRAIRIHQNLLSRPQLEESEHHLVHLELARDFMAAGLYDRAETLLQEVISESAELRSIAQRYLMDIYQNESEWQDAVDVARALLQSRYMKSNPEVRREVSRMIAHFYCQLAEEARLAGDNSAVARYLDLAASVDKTVVRVAMLNASLENAEGRYKQAIKTVGRIESQSAEGFAACLPVLMDSYLQLNGEKGFDQFVQHVQAHLEKSKSTLAVIFVVEQLLGRAVEEPQRLVQAEELLSRHVVDHASLTASNKLVELRLQQDSISDTVQRDVENLHQQVDTLLAKRHFYRCSSCGFSGRQLHWRCPSCKQWESIHRLEDLSSV